MAHEERLPAVNLDDLRAFHAKHFPSAPQLEHLLPDFESAPEPVQDCQNADDGGLGFYFDGVERTLDDEDVAWFRRSEIQTILRRRRQRREDGEVSEDDGAPATPTSAVDCPGSLLIGAVAPDASTLAGQSGASLVEGKDKVQSGRVEKPKQQWATSSARTKARNKKHNKNYRRKKKEERKKKEAKEAEDDESDEWDPWHQANGPDVQKEAPVDLDY
ncbi:hypothetical protein N0V83_004173 [Neocucurbitaria cava]|uniref:Uncharacterized protein n=1 Tax=Neocucurbitaria cava TaxID=798079 RepID=A0A9W9CNV1_9PLEO|nr:hypothetical protein N0V83_004173 [Neocucurbitaria cava]